MKINKTVVLDVNGTIIARTPRKYYSALSDAVGKGFYKINEPAEVLVKDGIQIDAINSSLKKINFALPSLEVIPIIKKLGGRVFLTGNISRDIGDALKSSCDVDGTAFSYETGFLSEDDQFFSNIDEIVGECRKHFIGSDPVFSYRNAKKHGWDATLVDISGRTPMAFGNLTSVFIDLYR